MKIQKITIDDLADTLAVSTITKTIDTGGILTHSITHPILGECQTVQADGDALLFSCL